MTRRPTPIEIRLREAVISDDRATFERLVADDPALKRVAFGRFPVESLLVMYGARKILKKFTPEPGEYIYVDEFGDDYRLFKQKAGAALRLYTDGKIVPPDEMRLLSGEAVSDEKIKADGARLENVYRLSERHSLKRDRSGAAVAPVARRMSTAQRLTVLTAALIAVIFVLTASGLLAWVALSYGDGSSLAPALVDNAAKLTGSMSQNDEAYIRITDNFTLDLSAAPASSFSGYIDGGGHTLYATGGYLGDPFGSAAALGRVTDLTIVYDGFRAEYSGGVRRVVLERDFTLSASSHTPPALQSVLDGNGHSIRVTDGYSGALFTSITGGLYDVDIVFDEINGSYSSSDGFIATVNDGAIEDVSLSVSGELEELNRTEDVYFGGFVSENRGTVNRVLADMRLSLVSDFDSGESSGNSYFAMIAGINSGTVSHAETTAESSITSVSLDISGIVSENASGAVVDNSVNRAAIATSSSLPEWSPNAAGVVLTNYGTVRDSYNFGNIRADSSATVPAGATNAPAVYLGGVVAQNFYIVMRSYNGGDISSLSGGALPFVGGIAGLSLATLSDASVSECISGGTIGVSAENIPDNFLTGVGGIVGMAQSNYNYTVSITNSFSLMTLSVSGDNLNSGGIVGTLDSRQGFFTYGVEGTDGECLYADTADTDLCIGFAMYYNYGVLFSGRVAGGARPADEITSREDFWYVEK